MNGIKLETKFGDTNFEYKKYRPAYPAELFDIILRSGNGSCEEALDIGAGTGISTEILANIFKNVTAVEPDEKMTRAGNFAGNVTVINECTENIKLPERKFDLIAAGNAFYWMEAELVMPLLNVWLKEEGIIAAYRYNLPVTDNEKVNEIIHDELIHNWDRFRHERLRDTAYTYRNLKNSDFFKNTRIFQIKNIVQLEIGSLTGFFSSTSYVSAFLKTLVTPQDYLDSLSAKIADGCKCRVINVDFGLELVIAEKNRR